MATIKQLDEQFEDFLNKLTFEQTETDLTPELRAKRRALADGDEFQFCKIYFPQIFDDEWSDLHRHIKSLKRGIHYVSGSRKFGKTAFGLISKLVKPICEGGTGLFGLGMRTQDDSYERGDALTRLIKRNPKLCYDYDVQFQQDKKGYWIINNVTFVGVGAQEGLRNFADENFKRFKILILDDLFNRITVRSVVDNEKVYQFITSEAEGQMNDDGLMIVFFNIIINESPGDRISKEHPGRAYNFPALNEKEETNWPESKTYTTAFLHAKRDSMNLEIWMGDWMNQPVLIGEIFDPAWIRTINVNTIQISASLTAADPSYGKSPSACYKGLITMGITSKKRKVILDVYLRKEDYFQVFDYIDNIRLVTPHWKILLFENDFSQWSMAMPYYDLWREKRERTLPIYTITTKVLATEHYGSDKEGRIMNLVYPHQTGSLLYNEAIMNNADFKLYRQQLLSFGKSTQKLDGPDAAATAFILINRYIEQGTFKSTGARRAKTSLLRKI